MKFHLHLHSHIAFPHACVFVCMLLFSPHGRGEEHKALARAGWQRRRPSLGLTQAERPFLHILCHTIWGPCVWACLFSGPPWQLRVHTDICSSHQTSWWRSTTTNNRTYFIDVFIQSFMFSRSSKHWYCIINCWICSCMPCKNILSGELPIIYWFKTFGKAMRKYIGNLSHHIVRMG